MRAADGPAALTTRGAAIAPSEVVTPVTRPPARSIDVTRTPSTIFAPSSRARRAKPAVTSAGPARPSPGPHTAAIRSFTRSAGTSVRASSGVITRTSAPSLRWSAMRSSNPGRCFGSEIRNR